MTTINLNAKRAAYFANPAHGKIDIFFFTSDDECFKTQSNAAGQAANLVKNGKPGEIDMVTRAEYMVWKGVSGAQIAESAHTDPIAAAATQTAIDDTQKGTDANALATAVSALDSAKANGNAAAIEAAQQSVDKISAQLNSDNARLSADASAASAAQKANIARATKKLAAAQAVLKEAKAAGGTADELAPLQADVTAAQNALAELTNAN